MASTGVIMPDKIIKGRTKEKEQTRDCWDVLQKDEIAKPKPTKHRAKINKIIKRTNIDPLKGIAK